MCDYTGHEFGASYPDSVCIKGYLFDADSDGCSHGGEWACPRCNTAQMLADAREEAEEGASGCVGFGAGARPYCAMTRWEAACAKALAENPVDAARILEGFGTLILDDWPDRQAVYDGRARWDVTVPKPWSFSEASAQP
jgi:hypothetical protein